jgi:hypothetical protein
MEGCGAGVRLQELERDDLRVRDLAGGMAWRAALETSGLE